MGCPVQSLDTSRDSGDRGAKIHDFDPTACARNLDPDEMGRASQLAVAAARLALSDAGSSPVAYRCRSAVADHATMNEPEEAPCGN